MLQQNIFDPNGPQQTLQQQPTAPAMPYRAAYLPSTSYAPISSPMEGVSRVAQAMMSGYRAGRPNAYTSRPDFSDTGLGQALGSIFGPSLNF